MAMSKQDYEKIAWALRYAAEDCDNELTPKGIAWANAMGFTVQRIIEALRGTNPRFNADRFRQYVTSHCVNLRRAGRKGREPILQCLCKTSEKRLDRVKLWWY